MRGVMLVAVIMMMGCKKAPPEVTMDTTKVAVGATVDAASLAERRAAAIDQMHANFTRVMFELDSSDLGESSLGALKENARIMGAFPDLNVEIQGHADERGTTEYNLGLGERRAATVQRAMSSMGVDTARLAVLTYGEERPVNPSSNETAWSQNRRVEFRVLVAKEGVSGTTP